jgi:hypothetical protein
LTPLESACVIEPDTRVNVRVVELGPPRTATVAEIRVVGTSVPSSIRNRGAKAIAQAARVMTVKTCRVSFVDRGKMQSIDVLAEMLEP